MNAPRLAVVESGPDEIAARRTGGLGRAADTPGRRPHGLADVPPAVCTRMLANANRAVIAKGRAGMAELVDAQVSKTCSFTGVSVRSRLPAPSSQLGVLRGLAGCLSVLSLTMDHSHADVLAPSL